MFQILGETKWPLMRYANVYLVVSGLVFAGALVALFAPGINFGLEFTGGTEVQLKFRESRDDAAIRGAVADAMARQGFEGSPVIQRIGAKGSNEVLIRVGTVGEGGDAEIATKLVVDALESDADRAAEGKTDVNRVESNQLQELLVAAPGIDGDAAAAFAGEFAAHRREQAVLKSLDELSGLASSTPEIDAWLAENAHAGSFALRGQSYIGPAVGDELLDKAKWAIILSLLGVLAYIAFRFQWQWGIAALVALFHDTVITLGLFALAGQEMSIAVVAAFLTLIGYSVNDTVVVFDRIRENLRVRAGRSFVQIIDDSINRTLSRTIITSGLTFLVVVGLLILGGKALTGLAFVLTIGVIVGTYSSICIASPVLLRLKALRERGAKGGGGERAKRRVSAPESGGVAASS